MVQLMLYEAVGLQNQMVFCGRFAPFYATECQSLLSCRNLTAKLRLFIY
jgi:hypothetical protein